MTKLRLALLVLAAIGAAALALLTEPPRKQRPVSEVTSWLKTDGGSACRIPPIDITPDETMLRKLFAWKEMGA
jgi:hypothetical protein